MLAKHVTDRDLGLKAFIRQLDIARVVEVTVGIHADKFSKGESIAYYGAVNEFGTDDGHIHERPFMRSSFDENISAINEDLALQYHLVMMGQSTVKRGLSIVGMKHVSRIKTKITSNIQPANAPSTIKRKKSSRTLIDTGAMLNSVHYVVGSKK